MERPIISFILGKDVRPKPDTEDLKAITQKPRNDGTWAFAHNGYSDLKPEDLPTSEIGDGTIFIEDL